MSRGIPLICFFLTSCAVVSAGAQPALLPVHALGDVSDARLRTVAEAFVHEVAAISEEPVTLLNGGPCPLPHSCLESERSDNYWIQVSGSDSGLVAVAHRLDHRGVLCARQVAEGAPGDEAKMARALAAGVAAGVAEDLVITAGSLRGAAVAVDGDAVGRTPYRSRSAVEAGFHLVQIRARDGRTAAAVVQARADERVVLDLDFTAIPEATSRRRAAAWPLIPILAGSAVAAILLAADPAGVIGPDYTITVDR